MEMVRQGSIIIIIIIIMVFIENGHNHHRGWSPEKEKVGQATSSGSWSWSWWWISPVSHLLKTVDGEYDEGEDDDVDYVHIWQACNWIRLLSIEFSVEGEVAIFANIFSQHCNICKYQVMALSTLPIIFCVEIHQLNLSRFKVVH